MDAVEVAAKLCDVEVIDYWQPHDHRGDGVIVGSGCGVMMAIMDHCPTLRWATDMDSLPRGRWAEFIDAVALNRQPVVLAGWFSHTSPSVFREAAARHGARVFVYGGSKRIGGAREATTLAELISMVNEADKIKSA